MEGQILNRPFITAPQLICSELISPFVMSYQKNICKIYYLKDIVSINIFKYYVKSIVFININYISIQISNKSFKN